MTRIWVQPEHARTQHPAIVVERPDGTITRHHKVLVDGPSWLVQDGSVRRGPSVWIETEATVTGA